MTRASAMFPVLIVAALQGACSDHDHPHADEHAGDHGHAHADDHAAAHVDDHASEHASGAEHGHGHGDESDLPGTAVTHFAASDDDVIKSELFVEFSPLIVGKETSFAAHLTDTGELWTAVLEGKLTVVLEGEGQRETFTSLAPAVPGIFRPVAKPKSAGTRRLSFVLERDLRRVVHDVGEVRVYASQAEAEKALASHHDEEEAGAISFLKEQAWKLDFALAEAKAASLRPSQAVFGEVTTRAGGDAKVLAPMAGRVAAAEEDIPRVGDVVRRGQALLAIVPRVEGGGQVSELILKKEQATLALSRAKRERERLVGLLAKGAVAERRVDEARSEEQRANAELAGAERLLAQHEGGQRLSGGAGQVVVRSPLDGTLAAAPVVSGGFVEEGSLLFRVVDLDGLRLDLRVPEADAHALDDVTGGFFRLVGHGAIHELSSHEDKPLRLGRVLDERSRTFPLRVPLASAPAGVGVGAAVDARLYVGAPREVVAIPEAAVVDEAGMDVAYVQLGGESFERRVLKLGVRDRGLVEVKEGLKAGERVVSTGALYVRLASSGDAAPAHGHPH